MGICTARTGATLTPRLSWRSSATARARSSERGARARPQHLAARTVRHPAARRDGRRRGEGRATRRRPDAGLPDCSPASTREAQRGGRPEGPGRGDAVLEAAAGGRCRGRGIPARCGAAARGGRRERAAREPVRRVLLDLRVRTARTARRAPRPRHRLPGVGGDARPRTSDDEPVVPRPPIADLAGGVYAALAVCAALVQRSRTGEGESIDVSMTDVLASSTGAVPPLTLSDGQAVGGQVAGYGTFQTADGGWIALGVISEDHFWTGLMRTLGLDDAAALTFPERLALGHTLTERIAKAIAERDRDDVVRGSRPRRPGVTDPVATRDGSCGRFPCPRHDRRRAGRRASHAAPTSVPASPAHTPTTSRRSSRGPSTSRPG